jgi:hypothetical protein
MLRQIGSNVSKGNYLGHACSPEAIYLPRPRVALGGMVNQ